MQIPISRNKFPTLRHFSSFITHVNTLTNGGAMKLEAYGPDTVIGFVDAEFFHYWCKENNLVDINLYPDMSRSQYTKNDTFIYGAPITTRWWMELQKWCRRTNERVGYLLPDDLQGLDDVIILRTPQMTDDDCMTASAYVRIVDNCTARAYCLPHKERITYADIINATAGAAPRALCKMLTLAAFEKEARENNDVQTV